MLRVATVTVLLLLFGTPLAHANVDNLIGQLSDPSDRVRMSAVLALTNLESPRAIDALAKTLLNKRETKNIRGVAANALGKIVANGSPSSAQRKTAINALAAAKDDPEPFVSAKADAALSQIGATVPASAAKPSGGGGIYVNIGPMSSKTNTASDSQFRTLMQKTAASTMGKVARSMQITWPGGNPSKAALDKKGVAGFYVDGTLNEVKIEKSGNSSKVSCKVNMLLASYPEKSVFGFLNGGAAVQASASASDIALAQQDCVAAVVESLIAKQIVPTIKSKVGP
jgi:hypothetical protein